VVVSLSVVGAENDGLDGSVFFYESFKFSLTLRRKGFCVVIDQILLGNFVWNVRVDTLGWENIVVVIINDRPFIVAAINARNCA